MKCTFSEGKWKWHLKNKTAILKSVEATGGCPHQKPPLCRIQVGCSLVQHRSRGPVLGQVHITSADVYIFTSADVDKQDPSVYILFPEINPSFFVRIFFIPVAGKSGYFFRILRQMLL